MHETMSSSNHTVTKNPAEKSKLFFAQLFSQVKRKKETTQKTADCFDYTAFFKQSLTVHILIKLVVFSISIGYV